MAKRRSLAIALSSILFIQVPGLTQEPQTGQNKDIPIHKKPLSIDKGQYSPVQEKKTTRSDFEIDSILDGKKSDSPSVKDLLDKVSIQVAPANRGAKKFYRCKVTVKNGTGKVLQVKGNQARVNYAGKSQQCVSMQQVIDDITGGRPSMGQKVYKTTRNSVTALVSVGSIPAIKDEIEHRGDIRKRYGTDEVRREEQLGRFSNRVLYPGQSTSGYIYFAKNIVRAKTFTIPVCDFYDQKDSASLSYRLLQ